MNRANRIGSTSIWILTIFFGFFSSAASQETITMEEAYPVQNEKTRIIIQTAEGNPVGGAQVTAVYRPGTRVSVESAIGATDNEGIVEWTPEHAGIVSISASRPVEDGDEILATINVSVKFASTPAGGMLIMILAGILLIGGSVVRFTRYLRGGGF